MPKKIIDSFMPRFGNTKIDITTEIGAVSGPESFKLSAKRSGDSINATITYQSQHSVRYALNQLLDFVNSNKSEITISSSPDFPVRGVVEGFYGKPWSHVQRLRAIEKFGDFNFNTYFIAPKDVPWQRFNWRQPFNSEFISLTRELISKGNENGVSVTACVSPGLSVKYSDLKDVDSVVTRFKQLYDAGSRHFSLLWDDIAWELQHPEDIETFPTTAAAQAWFTNQVWNAMLNVDNNIQMTVCPMHYCGRGNEPYLVDIGPLLNPRINLMWTGRDICSGYLDIADAVIFQRSTLRPPLYWDNFPVNDGSMQKNLYIGPLRNREVGLNRYSAGLLSNPMLQFEMSLFPLKTVGDYLWNTQNYNPEDSWEDGLIKLLPDSTSRNAVRSFMRCTMGSNVGGDPAPDLRQVFRRGVTAWRSGNLVEAGDEFISEGTKMLSNASFLESKEFKYPDILTEIKPWLEKYRLGANALIGLGEALHKCTFNYVEHRIQGDAEVIKSLESIVDTYLGSRKVMFGDQIDGPINELIAELSA
jgi:hyaluronoglucosaminidase